MDEMMSLVNGVGMSAAEVTSCLSKIGNGNMLDGISNIYYSALEVGDGIGYRRRLLEEALEASDNNTRQKVIIGGVCLLVGAGVTIGGVWLSKKLRSKREEIKTVSVQTADNNLLSDESEIVSELQSEQTDTEKINRHS